MTERSTPGALGALALAASLASLCACSPSAPVPRAAGRPVAGAAPAPAVAAAAPVDPGTVHAVRLPVRFGDVRRLASSLDDVFQPDARGTGPVRAILVDEATDELVVLGTDAGIESVRQLLAPGCSFPTDASDEVDVVYLEHADAQSVLRLVGPVVDRPTRIMADSTVNAIVLRGSSEAVERVKKTVAALDVARER